MAFEVDVETVEAVPVDDGADRGDKGVPCPGRSELHLAVLAADGQQCLLALCLLGPDGADELGLGLDPGALGRWAEPELDAPGGDRGGLAEGEGDDIPGVGYTTGLWPAVTSWSRMKRYATSSPRSTGPVRPHLPALLVGAHAGDVDERRS